MSKICVVIPCYNEHNRILGNDFLIFLRNHNNFSFVFVDDGSTDETFSVLERLSAQHERITSYKLDQNKGKATAVKFGIEKVIQADFSYYGFIDADLAIPLDELGRLHNEIKEEGIEFVYSSKNTKLNKNLEMKFKRFLVGRILAKMVKLSLKIDVYDTQCGCKMMTKDVVKIAFKDKFISSWLFDIEIFWRLINAFGVDYIQKKTKEVPLQQLFNRGSSKVHITDLLSLPIEFYKIHQFYKAK